MARYITPEQYVTNLRVAAVVARRKGMTDEANECGRLADEASAKIKREG